MPIQIEKVKQFARMFDIAEKTADTCLVLLDFMPQIDKGPFNVHITKLYDNLHNVEAQILATTKDWLDNELGMKEGLRRNAWSNRKLQFWNVILKPSSMAKGILQQFVDVIGK